MGKKQAAWDAVCRAVQSAALAAEITAAADIALAAGDGLPRAAFWLLFAVTAALTAAALFFAWKGAAPKAAYDAPETKAVFSGKRILVVVPHEDDDLNLTAGMLETLAGENEVYVLFLSSGDAGAPGETRVNEALGAPSRRRVGGERHFSRLRRQCPARRYTYL